MKRQHIIWIAVCIPACLVCMAGGMLSGEVFGAIIDPVAVAFANPIGVAQAMDDNPTAVVRILEAHITQKQADDIEAALFPVEANEDARLQVLRLRLVESRKYMLRIGLPPNDTDVAHLQQRIDAIPAPVSIVPGPAVVERTP